jgi:membrane protease subunit HflC
MFSRASTTVQELGVELIDVRIQRIDLPDEVSGSVYQRMQENFNALGGPASISGTTGPREKTRERSRSIADAGVRLDTQ